MHVQVLTEHGAQTIHEHSSANHKPGLARWNGASLGLPWRLEVGSGPALSLDEQDESSERKLLHKHTMENCFVEVESFDLD